MVNSEKVWLKLKNGKDMQESQLIIKSKEFALKIIRVCNELKNTKKESVLTNQLVRSGTSVGANIREAFYAHGKRILSLNYKSH